MTADAPVAEIQKALREEGLDAWLLYDFRGLNPLAARVLRLDPDVPRTRRWFYLIPAEGSPVRLVHAIEAHVLAGLPGERRLYASHQDLETGLKELLKGLKTVAMEYSPNADVPTISRVDAGTLELVRAAGAKVVSSGDLVQAFEATLSAAQLKTHWQAARLLRDSVFEAFRFIAKSLGKKKLSELDVQRFLLDRFKENALVCDHPPIVAVGPHSANPHYMPTPEASTRLRAGDLLLIDLWAKVDRPDGVYADITWMGYAGTHVPEKYAKVFRVVRQARDAAVRAVESAASHRRVLHGWEVDDAARAVIRKAGFAGQFIHRTGHSIGFEVHGSGANMDNYETKDTRKLAPGSLFSIEPGIYQNLFGVRSEINVFFGADEAYVTTAPAQTEILPLLKPGTLNG